MEKRCLVCNQSFHGRQDKKFCSDQCRATFNNSQKKELDKVVIGINKVLKSNRNILKSINPVGKTTVRMEFLKLQGFDFKFHTHIYTSSRKNTYYFCYEYGYMHVQDEKVLIVNWQTYMGKLPI